MKTTINNNLRVYHVVTSTGHQYFCNIEDLNRVVIENNLRSGYFKIYHFWDNKPKLLSSKLLKQMFEGSQLKQEFEIKSTYIALYRNR
jgi:hypothetical protein